jgi:acetyltransferase-like isoleucine patch superfamily enzyme
MRNLFKQFVEALFLILLFVPALLTGFGRLRPMYLFIAQAVALAPGLPGDYARMAFYRLTLTNCDRRSRICFGSYFAHSAATVGRGVYIGAYSVLGRVQIGDRTQIANSVQVLSGRRQHKRGHDGRIHGAESGEFEQISIGEDCWIGAGAIVMASVGARSTVGAGAVVVKPVPTDVLVVGNPARVPVSSTTMEA